MENKITSIRSAHIFGDNIPFHISPYAHINEYLLYLPDEIFLASFRVILVPIHKMFIKFIYVLKDVLYGDRFGIPSSLKMNY